MSAIRKLRAGTKLFGVVSLPGSSEVKFGRGEEPFADRPVDDPQVCGDLLQAVAFRLRYFEKIRRQSHRAQGGKGLTPLFASIQTPIEEYSAPLVVLCAQP